MIIVRISSGLGNQMFQYAMAKALAKKLNVEVKFDINSFKDNYIGRKFQLDFFKTEFQIATEEEINSLIKKKSKMPGILRKIFSKPKYFSSEYKEKQNFIFDPDLFKVKDNTYIQGYWQHEKYFINIQNQIVNDFTLRNEFNDINLDFLEKIQNTNSISIHVRCDDYIHNPVIRNSFNVCGLDYYQKAINCITEKVSNPHFFVFSDDIPWAKENLTTNYPITYVDCNDNTPYFDMILMSKCKYNIIPNSSFSWWAAWLNKNPEKIVIAPKIWKNTENAHQIDIVPESWIKI